MGIIDRSAASLRLIGDDLDPAEITSLLGAAPTEAYRRGDTLLTPKGQPHIVRHGAWMLETPDSEPADLDRQIATLMQPLTTDPMVWTGLAARYRVEVFVGLFFDDGNQRLTISPHTHRLLAERQITLDLDLYAVGGLSAKTPIR